MYVDDSHSEGQSLHEHVHVCLQNHHFISYCTYWNFHSEVLSLVSLNEWYIFTVICFQSLKCVCQEGKSQHVWNKNIIPWEVLNWFLFMSCNASKNSLVSCAHSFVFFNALQLLNKIVGVHFHGTISMIDAWKFSSTCN